MFLRESYHLTSSPRPSWGGLGVSTRAAWFILRDPRSFGGASLGSGVGISSSGRKSLLSTSSSRWSSPCWFVTLCLLFLLKDPCSFCGAFPGGGGGSSSSSREGLLSTSFSRWSPPC
ncbi:hypothetical protein Salat_0217600 [Sesamum alatum]|uniref:Uncharacterized protein n=1 Tax=Sesamum alatum TaxID=300844 RepID=A0AAE2CY92_9LAMI|nr:hypothetical protein Salat_0217600 [Sesamum alatum]